MSVFRIEPVAPVQAYKTYGIKQPLSTHWRRATCAEINCAAYLNGWTTIVPVAGPQAQYIRARSGRRFTEVKQDAGMVEFAFPPGQTCFAAAKHRAPLGRPPLFIVRDGDFRGNPSGWSMRHRRAEDWRDDLGEHQLKIVEFKKRG